MKVCGSRAQVCSHPAVLAEFDEWADSAADRLAAAGKLQLLDQLLDALHGDGQCILLLSQDAKVHPKLLLVFMWQNMFKDAYSIIWMPCSIVQCIIVLSEVVAHLHNNKYCQSLSFAMLLRHLVERQSTSRILQMLALLEAHLRERYGEDALEAMDGNTPSSARQAAIVRFNHPDRRASRTPAPLNLTKTLSMILKSRP